MTPKELYLKASLQANNLSDYHIFEIFFEYKTQQLSYALQKILQEEKDAAENFEV